ncbi:hypothetical protein EKO04_009536 [Ascochyta lentis]|uniref:Uncharacterized protein n=1 Tax=Ascochyta lentis TaxID=205686 RepID=A0A8H7MF43_9PLEO|nr:hypothetical protein EKO04_009536 [Ascochyta lentis]
MAMAFQLHPTTRPEPETTHRHRSKSHFPRKSKKPKCHLGKIIKQVKRYLHMVRSAHKYRSRPSLQEADTQSKPSPSGREESFSAMDERVLDDMGLCPLTRVSARRDEVEVGGQDEWRLEGEFSWGRSWVNWEGVRVVENDVWWR